MNRSVLLLVSLISLFSVFPARCGAYQDAVTDKRVAALRMCTIGFGDTVASAPTLKRNGLGWLGELGLSMA